MKLILCQTEGLHIGNQDVKIKDYIATHMFANQEQQKNIDLTWQKLTI